jgi:hypothetical protein
MVEPGAPGPRVETRRSLISLVDKADLDRPSVGGCCLAFPMTTTAALEPATAGQVLRAARAARRTADAAEAEQVRLAVEWALMHPADSIHQQATYVMRGFGDSDLALAGPGAPTVAEFCIAEFASVVGLSTEAGKHFVGEALELCYRLPRHWQRVMAGDLPAWKARIVARETIHLSPEAASYVDAHLAPTSHKLRPSQLDRTVAEAIARFMPDHAARIAEQAADQRHVTVHDQQVSFAGTMHVEAELDIPDALDLQAALRTRAAELEALGSTDPLDVRRAHALGDLARTQLALGLTGAEDTAPTRVARRRAQRQMVIHVHLSEAALRGSDPVARLERGDAVVTVDQVRAWCGRPDARVVVKPLLDLSACDEVDSDQVPDRHAEQLAVRDRTCVFPWCTRPARSCDCDHIVARGRAGPTCPCNLAPLCRRHHRLKTHSPWSYTALDPGTYLWTSPHGYQFLRDHNGTLDVSSDLPRAPRESDPADPRSRGGPTSRRE